MEDNTEAIRALNNACTHYCKKYMALFFVYLKSECSSQKAKLYFSVPWLLHETMLEVREIKTLH